MEFDNFVNGGKNSGVIAGFSNYGRGAAGISLDSGMSWSQGLPNQHLRVKGIATSADGSKIFVVTGVGDLYRSTDNGVNWELVYKYDEPGGFNSVAVTGDEHVVLALDKPSGGVGSAYGVMYQSPPSSTSRRIKASTFDVPSSETLFLTHSDGITIAHSIHYFFISRDNGVSFFKLNNELATVLQDEGITSVQPANDLSKKDSVNFYISTPKSVFIVQINKEDSSRDKWTQFDNIPASDSIRGVEGSEQMTSDVSVNHTGAYVMNTCVASSGCGPNLYAPASTSITLQVGENFCIVKWFGNSVTGEGSALVLQVIAPGPAQVNVWGTTFSSGGFNYSADKLRLIRAGGGEAWTKVYWKWDHYEGSNITCYPSWTPTPS